MKRMAILLAAALILAAFQAAGAQDDPLLKAFYERYYQPVSINEYSEPDLATMWGELKRFHADCAEITRERMKLAVVSMTADRLASIALSIPDNPWEAKSLLNLLGASSNVHQLLEDLGLESIGEGQSWLYKQLGYVGWIAALHDMGGTLQSMEGWWSLRRIGELSRGGLSPAQLKDLLNIELFALSVADELLDRLVVGQVRSTFRLDKMRVMLHSMCYSMASELEGLYRKAAERTLSHIEALALMALERDYLAKNVDIFALEMEYWRKEAEGWSPLDLLSWYGDEDRDRAMLELNRQKYETTKEHYQRWDHYITAVLGSLEGAASGEETYVGGEEVEEIPAVEEDYEIVGDESHERDRDRLLLERGAMSRAEYERKWGGGEAATGGGVRYEAEVAPDGSVVVIDCKPRVQRFSAEGGLLAYWGEEGEEPGKLGCSGGIAISRDGVLFISDPFDDRVQMFTLDGRFLGLLGGGRRASPQSLRQHN